MRAIRLLDAVLRVGWYRVRWLSCAARHPRANSRQRRGDVKLCFWSAVCLTAIRERTQLVGSWLRAPRSIGSYDTHTTHSVTRVHQHGLAKTVSSGNPFPLIVAENEQEEGE